MLAAIIINEDFEGEIIKPSANAEKYNDKDKGDPLTQDQSLSQALKDKVSPAVKMIQPPIQKQEVPDQI